MSARTPQSSHPSRQPDINSRVWTHVRSVRRILLIDTPSIFGARVKSLLAVVANSGQAMSSNRSRESSPPTPKVERSPKLDVSFLLNKSNKSPKGSDDENAAAKPAGSSSHKQNEDMRVKRYENRDKRNTCNQCGHCFVQSADLRKHVKTVHEGLRPFQCDICHKMFGEKGNLRKHRKSVHMNERPFQCDICPSTFAFKDGLARHVKVCHFMVSFTTQP